MSEESLFPKRCKVFPRNNHQFIPGILVNRKRIDLPAELPLSEHELRRCLSYANVYEMVGDKHVLLTMHNYLSDNTEAEAATDVPEDVEMNYPRDEEKSEDGEDDKEDSCPSKQSDSNPDINLRRVKDPTEPDDSDGVTIVNSDEAEG